MNLATATLRNIDNATYHAMHGLVSHSMMEVYRRSPRMYWHWYVSRDREPPSGSREMVLGSRIHAAVLEPDRFAARYVCAEDFDRRTKKGKAAAAAFAERNAGKEAIDPQDWIDITATATAVRQSEAANPLLSTVRNVEASITWEDAETRVLCRCRPDLICVLGDQLALVDLKTTSRGVSPESFARRMYEFGYHRQAAWYLDGLRALYADLQYTPRFYFIAVSPTWPYDVAVYQVAESAVVLGRQDNRRIITEIAAMREWPGFVPWKAKYQESVLELDLPAYAYRGDYDV